MYGPFMVLIYVGNWACNNNWHERQGLSSSTNGIVQMRVNKETNHHHLHLMITWYMDYFGEKCYSGLSNLPTMEIEIKHYSIFLSSDDASCRHFGYWNDNLGVLM